MSTATDIDLEQLGSNAAHRWFPKLLAAGTHRYVAHYYARGMPQETSTPPHLRLLYVVCPDSRDTTEPQVNKHLPFWPRSVPRDESEESHAFALAFCRTIYELCQH
jgi:hypothetical protein